MSKFIEIKTIHDRFVLLNVEQIEAVSEGIEVDHNFVEMINGVVYKINETIEEIKEKLK